MWVRDGGLVSVWVGSVFVEGARFLFWGGSGPIEGEGWSEDALSLKVLSNDFFEFISPCL